jgi:NADH dehydrogenase FAD-containing subunit
MGPGMLSRTYTPDQVRFATRRLVEKQGGVFIKAKAVRVDADRRQVLADNGQAYPYDVLSINAGSFVPAPEIEDTVPNLFSAKPIERLLDARQKLLEMATDRSVQVAVIGGGAAAVELAGNVWRLLTDHPTRGFTVRLYSGRGILDRFPARVGRAALRSLTRRRIEVSINSKVTRIGDGMIELEGGRRHHFDFCFLATGVRPPPLFMDSGLSTGPDGGLAVNANLQSIGHPDIFGGGDCIYFKPRPLDKVGVYAVRQNPVLFHNLLARLEGRSLQTFTPGGAYLLIFNMGDGRGILYKKGILLSNRAAFIAKDYIDRRFMRKFQTFE